jgi:RiboL-PSP-HEPN
VRSTLDELAKELDEMRSLVASISPVNAALSNHHDSVVKKYLIVRRRFDYAAIIVALYASFEKFLENLVGEYVNLMARQTQYADLPPKLTQKHLHKSADILSRGRLGEGRYTNLREVDVVKNLYDCLTGAQSYALNQVAVVAHDLNFQRDEINRLFSAVGIDQVCDLVRRSDAMLEWYSGTQTPSDTMQSVVPPATIEQRINGLVERRNQIAHRGGNPLDLLGQDELSDTIAFVEALCRSIFSVVVGKYFEKRYIESGAAVSLRLLEGPYQGGYVVVVDRPSEELYTEQPMFVVDPSGARWGRTVSLEVNNEPVATVDRNVTATDVGIKLSFKCPAETNLYALEADDDLVWSSPLSQ